MKFHYSQERDVVFCKAANKALLTLQGKKVSIFPDDMLFMIYALIKSLNQISWEETKIVWERDLGAEISEGEWKDSLTQVHTSSLCARFGLIQFKVLHPLHYSRDRLAKIFPNTNPAGLRCGNSPVSVGHMFWLCPFVK